LKALNRKYLIPFKLAAAGIFAIGGLLIIPGADLPGQKRLKEMALNV
jgi:hypothetical protein